MDQSIQTVPQQLPAVPKMPVNLPPTFAGLIQPQPAFFYANGFEIAITGADIIISLNLNNRHFASLNLSFTTAKALGEGLSRLVAGMEANSSTKVLSAEEIIKALEKMNKQG